MTAAQFVGLLVASGIVSGFVSAIVTGVVNRRNNRDTNQAAADSKTLEMLQWAAEMSADDAGSRRRLGIHTLERMGERSDLTEIQQDVVDAAISAAGEVARQKIAADPDAEVVYVDDNGEILEEDDDPGGA